MEIKHRIKEVKGEFIAIEENLEAGNMDYRMSEEGDMMISHTYVDPGFRGRNIAMQLVLAAVEYARQHNLKIIPLCSYVSHAFDKREEIRDVLKQR